jgi:hypothetical protein
MLVPGLPNHRSVRKFHYRSLQVGSRYRPVRSNTERNCCNTRFQVEVAKCSLRSLELLQFGCQMLRPGLPNHLSGRQFHYMQVPGTTKYIQVHSRIAPNRRSKQRQERS